MTKQVINLDYLNGLAKGNTVFVKEMIDMFLEDNPEEIQNLGQSIQNKNYTLIKEIAHKMKSTIAFMGLSPLIENELSEIEQLAINKSEINKIESLYLKVKEICDKAAEELKSELVNQNN
ncbi:MAG: Hpt domain-containing protein [Bacteroidota bacterium]